MTEPPTQHYPQDDPYGSSTVAPGGQPPSPPGHDPYGSAPAYGAPATAGPPRNGMGTAALVLGIVALLGFWTVILGILLGLLAVVFGVIGRKRASRGEATNGGAALAGAILGGLALVAGIVILAAGAAFFVHHKTDIQKFNDCVSKAQTDQQKQDCADRFKNTITG